MAQQNNVITLLLLRPQVRGRGVGLLAYLVSTELREVQGALMADGLTKRRAGALATFFSTATISHEVTLRQLRDAMERTRWRSGAARAGHVPQQRSLDRRTSDPDHLAAEAARSDLSLLDAPGGPSAIRQLGAWRQLQTPAILTGEFMDGDYWIGSVPNLSNFYVVNDGSKYGDDPSADAQRLLQKV